MRVRGSNPLLWKQEACIKHKPTLTLKHEDSGGKEMPSQKAFGRHFSSMIDSHGVVAAASLINTKGAEVELGDAYASAARLMEEPRLCYLTWDFHAKMKRMKYEKVELDFILILKFEHGGVPDIAVHVW